MKNLISTLIFPVLFIVSCVGPPDYSDGLLENKPAVINENDYFSLSLLGDKYTENEEWDLFINSNSTETLLTTLVIKDLNNSSTDSTFLLLTNEFGDTVMNVKYLMNWFLVVMTQSFTLALLQKYYFREKILQAG